MVLEDVDRNPAQTKHEVTPMSEIRRHKGMLLDVFTHINPGWQWSEKRLERLMHDEQGRCWVPMFDPDYEVYIDYDPLYTPEAEERMVEIARKAREDVQAGRFTYFDELDDEDDDLQCAFELR